MRHELTALIFVPSVLLGFGRSLVAWASMIKRLSRSQEHTHWAGTRRIQSSLTLITHRYFSAIARDSYHVFNCILINNIYRCHTTASGYVGPWSPSPTTFNNLYFVLLKGLQWTPNEKTQKFQYKGETTITLVKQQLP